MKSSLLNLATCSLLLSAVHAIPLERRQLGTLLNSIPATEIKPYKVEDLPPTLKKEGVRRIRITYGPFDIMGTEEAKVAKSPFRMDPGSTAWFNKINGGFPGDSTILMTNTTILLENGRPATVAEGVYNHHTVFFDMSKSSPATTSCPNLSWSQRALKPSSSPVTILAGTSEDSAKLVYTSSESTLNSGFWFSKTDKLMFMAEVVNYKNYTQKVFAVTDVEFVAGRAEGLLDAFPTILSVDMCSPPTQSGKPKGIELPHGQSKASFKSEPMVMARSGYFVHGIGHLHDGGDVIAIKVNGKTMCESKASYGGAGQETQGDDGKVWAALSSMGECDKPIRVEKDDKVELEAKYDLEAHPARKHAGGLMGEGEVMGLFAFSFAPDLMQ